MDDGNRLVWFRRKTYGYGWTPCTWQGWLITVLYIFGLVLMVVQLLPESNASSPVQLFMAVSIWTLALLVIMYRTGESTRWQWGRSSKKTGDENHV